MITYLNFSKLACYFTFLVFYNFALSQEDTVYLDTIYFENGDEIECNIESIAEKNITYTTEEQEDGKPIKIKLKKTPVDYVKLNNPGRFYLHSKAIIYTDSIYKIRDDYPEAFTTLIGDGKIKLYLFHHGKVIGNKTKNDSISETNKQLYTKGEYYTPTDWALQKQSDRLAVSASSKKIYNKKAFKNFMNNYISGCPKAVEKMNSKAFNKILLQILKVNELIDFYNSNCN